MFDAGAIESLGFRGISRWTLWPATMLMVASGLTSFALQWRTIGALVAWLWARKNKERAERYRIPAASGLIAGEALMAVAIILFAFAPDLMNDLRASLFRK